MKRILVLVVLFLSSNLGARNMSFINKTGKPVDILVQVPGVTHNANIVGEQPYADSVRYSLTACEDKQTINIPEVSVKSVYRTGDYIQRNLQWPTSFSAEMVTDKAHKMANAICPTVTSSPLEKVGYMKCFDLVVKQHADSDRMTMPDQDGKCYMISFDERHNKLNIKPFKGVALVKNAVTSESMMSMQNPFMMSEKAMDNERTMIMA